MNVKEYFKGQLEYYLGETAKLTKLLEELPEELAELEADTIYDLGYKRLVLSDKSHKDLGVKLATISGQSIRFDSSNASHLIAQFTDLGPFLWVDLRRPKKGCKTVRVRKPAQELTLMICGEIPEGYEYLGEVEE